tara:strand:- start:553 stop:1002 length:450 start_codon:yes stop_codon:yes gene_type:complete
MAHFAKIGTNGKVLQVLTLNNEDMLNANGVEDELVGQQYLENNNNWPAQMWVQTSYNSCKNQHNLGGTPFRGNYAGIGYTWDEDNQIFWPKKPYASWVKNISEARWQSPIGDDPELTAEHISQTAAETHYWIYNWNEEGQSWDLTNMLG